MRLHYTTLLLDGLPSCGIYGLGDDAPAAVPPHWAVYFSTDDTDAAVAVVTERGGNVAMPAMDTPFGRVAGVSDPQGAQFRVLELSPQPE